MIKILFATAAFTSGFYFLPQGQQVSAKSYANTTPVLTAVYDVKMKAVVIKWQQKTAGVKRFIVQRSDDNFNWEDIARVENPQNNGLKIWQYNDVKSDGGENYYRLQTVATSGQTTNSGSVMVITGGTHTWLMYPVPVTDVLTLQYKGAEKITGVINIIIQNMQGYVLTRLRCASNTVTIKIPVNNLGKGVYDIRITIANEVVWNQRFVK